MSEVTGNRCGHNPASLRLCDVVKKGKGGQHAILGIMSAYLGHAAKFRNRLKTWQRMNSTGRRRRSEAREAMAAVMQYLIAKDFQIDSRRCAFRMENGVHRAPDARLIALEISRSKAWTGKPALSEARVRAIITEFRHCGYLTLSTQHKRQRPTGEWESSPKVIQFTKQFFLELGGRKLWLKIKKLGQERTDAKLKYFLSLDESTAAPMMAAYYRLSAIFSPGQSKRLPPGWRPTHG